jgi:hypothetical protein
MIRKLLRERKRFTVFYCLTFGALIFLGRSALAADATTTVFSAGAYGTYAFVGNTISVAKTAPVDIGGGCGTTKIGASANGTVGSVTDPPLVITGVVNTAASNNGTSSTASADVHQVNLLAGLITADEVKAVSTTSEVGSSIQSSAAGSNFVNLVVAGSSVSGTPAPNTNIPLPGIGHVVLNEQITSTTSSSARLTVNMIHVYVTLANPLAVPTGTQIIVSSAHSSLTVAGGPAILDGDAYGTGIFGKLLRSSPTAPASVPCLGTDGSVITNTQLGVSLPPALTSGTIKDTAEGDITPALANSQTTSTIEALNLVSGTLTADAIVADASASTPDEINFSFSDSSSFVNLKVAGHPEITDNVPPNTQVNLDGLGTLWLHRVITTSNQIQIIMVELQVDESNTFGLPLGTDVRVGKASASLHSNSKP